jgi:Protein of unknown function (DUF3800)
MQIIYIDDSRDEKLCVFSALAIPASKWADALDQLKTYRRSLRGSDGIYIYKEFHATDFVAGRGRLADRTVTKFRRSQIFAETLEIAASLPGARLFNAVGPAKADERTFEYLLNRVQRAMEGWHAGAVLVCAAGKEAAYTRLRRRMGVHNPIPSRYGFWPESGKATKNIPLSRVVEDVFFKDSQQSYFVQVADFCAFSLLRREHPIPSRSKYGVDRAFDVLDPILVKRASGQDPLGIIRV